MSTFWAAIEATSRACSRNRSSAATCHWRNESQPSTATMAAGATMAARVSADRRAPGERTVPQLSSASSRWIIRSVSA